MSDASAARSRPSSGRPSLGREADRIEALQERLRRCPDSTAAKNDLAYVLATTPLLELRDGATALRLAREAVSTGGERPDFLDTLACAQAEAGHFEDAVETAGRAIEMLRRRGISAEAIREVEGHRKLFASRRRVGAPTEASPAE